MKGKNRHRAFLLIAFWLFIQPIDLLSQSAPGFRHFGLEEGLPSMRVYRMLEDKEGFLWLATDAGVSRFDGKRFDNFSTLDGLGDNDIVSLVQDSMGRIWFLPYSGRMSFYLDGQFHNSTTDPWLANAENRDPLIDFYIDRKKRLWLLSSRNGIVKIDGNSATRLLDRDPNFSSNVANVFEFSDGTMFFSCPNLAHKLEIEPGLIAQSRVFPCSTLSVSNSRKSESRGSKFLSLCGYVLDEFDLESGEFQNIIDLGVGNNVNRLEWLENGWVWVHLVGKGSMQIHWDGKNANLEKIWLPGMNISDFLEDSQGRKWFATLDDGIYLENSTPGFENVIPGIGKKLLYSRGDELAYLVGDVLWMKNKEGNFAKRVETGHVLKGIAWGERSNCYFIHSDFLLYSFYPEKAQSAQLISLMNFQMKTNQRVLKAMIEIGRDSLLLGNDIGISLFANGIEERLWPRKEDAESIRLTQLLQASNGDIWAGSNEGCWIFEDVYQGIPYRLADVSGQVTALQEDVFGNIWIGTNGNGISVISEGGIRFKITTQDGLVDNFIQRIKFSGDSTAWVCTNTGITQIDFGKGGIEFLKSYSNQDGLPPAQYLDIYPDGEKLLIAAKDGLFEGQLNQVQIGNPQKVVTRIARVEVQGEIVPIAESYELSFDQNDIVVSARAISLANGKNAVVSYQINRNGGWQRMQGENLELANLPPGKYEISFQSELLGQQQKGNTATLTFIIHPPFWGTWWFIFLEILLGLGIVALVVRAYLLSRARRENVARRLTQSRLTALRSQMNPHFIFNSLNSIQNFVANNDHQEAFLYLSRFGKLMRRVLDNSEHDMIPLEEEVDTLELYLQLEQLRSNNGFDFEIIIAEELEPEFHEVPPTLIQPMLENAIWHGVMHRETKGKIWLEFSLEKDEVVVCRVRDNGVGRATAQKMEATYKKDHKSKGLSITQERMALLNERLKSKIAMEIIDLFDGEKKPLGTEVVLRVPNKA